MTDSRPVHPSQIERHLERVLSDADEVGLPLVRDVLHESRDRWYGQLVVSVYDTLSDHQDREAVLPAAVAIELLRGYVRLRSRLLVTLTDNHAHSPTQDPTAALLAGDYLYTAAFSSLRSGPDSPPGDCFKILTTCLETITGAFARTYTAAGPADHDQAMFLDDTTGSLGEGAAALGATLAGFDEPARPHCEQIGRGLSTARPINHVLDTDPNEAMVVPSTFDESQFRMHAEQRRDDAAQALDTLSETVDVTRLRPFAEGLQRNRTSGVQLLMTTHSITVPDAWQIHTAHGRYEETMFEFQFESPASTDLYVRLVGQSSSEYDAVYTTTVVLNNGDNHSVTAGECTSEEEAMVTTEELLHSIQQSIRAEARTLDELDAETLEAIVGRYRYGKLRFRIQTLLDTFQNSQDTD